MKNAGARYVLLDGHEPAISDTTVDLERRVLSPVRSGSNQNGARQVAF